MTDNELNEAVAKKLGYTHLRIEIGDRAMTRELYGTRATDGTRRIIPDYCHSIAAAWEILAKLVPPGGVVRLEGPYFDGLECGYVDIGGAYICLSRADTAPMAICLAFLKLKEKS